MAVCKTVRPITAGTGGRLKTKLLAAAAVVTTLLLGAPSPASASTWTKGDVFVGVGDAKYKVFSNNGVFKETIDQLIDSGGETTGCAFTPDQSKLYTTNFQNNRVVSFGDPHPHSILKTFTTGPSSNESIVFDSAGNYYVGHADGDQNVEKYSPADALLDTYDVETEVRGSDWIELAADQKTLFYTSEGSTIKRFDVSTNTQLSDFATGLTQAFALRLLPPGDGSNGLLVADTVNIKRLDSNGDVVQTYDASGEDFWFALNLDPNGTSFWSARHGSGNFYRFNINTGAIELGPINSGEGDSIAGLCVKGEPTAGTPPPEEPPPEPDTRDHAQGFVGPHGGTVETDGPATRDNPHWTRVRVPPGFPGLVKIDEGERATCDTDRRYVCLFTDIRSPTTTRTDPMRFLFTYDKSRFPAGTRIQRIRILHNGDPIPRCDLDPDERELEQGQRSCHAKTVRLENRDVRFVVLTRVNGRWRAR